MFIGPMLFTGDDRLVGGIGAVAEKWAVKVQL